MPIEPIETKLNFNYIYHLALPDFKFANAGLGEIIGTLLNYTLTIAGLALLVYLIYGGLQLILSDGEPKAIQEAKSKITFAIVGFILIFCAFWIVQIFGLIFGIQNPLFKSLFGL